MKIYKNYKLKKFIKIKHKYFWGLGIGDWGLGICPNPQSPIPIPNPQSPIPLLFIKLIFTCIKLNK
jgi:hypothetical protein